MHKLHTKVLWETTNIEERQDLRIIHYRSESLTQLKVNLSFLRYYVLLVQYLEFHEQPFAIAEPHSKELRPMSLQCWVITGSKRTEELRLLSYNRRINQTEACNNPGKRRRSAELSINTVFEAGMRVKRPDGNSQGSNIPGLSKSGTVIM